MAVKGSLTLSIGLILAAATWAPAWAEGDPDAGKTIFKKCAACHTLIEGKKKIGPSLHGVIGRTAGTAKGFRYSKAMKAYGVSGVVWSAETLDPYLVAPRKVVKGTKMSFPGLKNEADRANVIAYLEQFSKKE
jgi:cytochrome c